MQLVTLLADQFCAGLEKTLELLGRTSVTVVHVSKNDQFCTSAMVSRYLFFQHLEKRSQAKTTLIKLGTALHKCAKFAGFQVNKKITGEFLA